MHAAAAYRQALGSHPSDGAALVGLAETGYPDLMTDVPIGLCRRAVWSATDQDVVFTALTALASSSIRRGDPRRAQALISGALALLPSSSVGWTNLSEVLRMLDAGGDAACAASRALTLSSIDLGALLNRALAFVALERLPDAVRDLRCAISLAPADHRGYANVLDALVAMARFEDVPLLGRRLAALAPGLNSVRHFFGVALLSAGHLSLAWKELEYRYRDPPVVRRRPFALPWWNGHPLPAGTTLLIWGEQGLGDEVIHASMIPDLIARGHSVVLECDHRLTSIYARSFPKIEVIPRTDPPQPRATAPDVVAQMAMGSLGGWLRPDIASFRPSSPYVTPDPVRVEDWRRRLGGLGPGLKVGIAWRSLRRDSFARRFHTRLSDWGPILTGPARNSSISSTTTAPMSYATLDGCTGAKSTPLLILTCSMTSRARLRSVPRWTSSSPRRRRRIASQRRPACRHGCCCAAATPVHSEPITAPGCHGHGGTCARQPRRGRLRSFAWPTTFANSRRGRPSVP
jgi:hypothetical protein